MTNNLMDKIVSLCKRRGFIFQSSEIYGGLGSVWDYGPLGVELKNNVKRAWWKSVVYQREDMVGLDAAILMHPKVWEASGHTESFADVLIDCKSCKKRFRKDKIEGKCPECGGKDFTSPRSFNLMFKVPVGAVQENQENIYLRPETAQGIFVNFLNILDTSRKKLPFGVAQIGKAFRNEITPGNFTFRTREFEQMEIEYFVPPKEADKYYKFWVEERFNWYFKFGIKRENLRKREHTKDELAHYAASCTDIEYNFPFSTSSKDGNWSELEGIANRTDFDLKRHSEFSGKELKYFDDEIKEKFFPYIIEPSGGVDRATLAFLVDAYYEEKVHPVRDKTPKASDGCLRQPISNGVKDDTRALLKLHHDLAPIKVAVLPLLKNRPQIVELAKKIAQDLKNKIVCVYDATAAIGKLYRRQDEVGTPFCVTIDVQSLEDKKATVRDRDTMQQDRVDIEQLENYLTEKLR